MEKEDIILDSLKKENIHKGFNIPDNYFDSFEDSLLNRIEAEEKPVTRKLITVIKPWLSLAAIFTVIAVVYYSTPFFKSTDEFAVTDFSNTSIEYLSSNFDEMELINIIADDENIELFESVQNNNELLKGLSYDDIESIVLF